ncbi:Uma2 family endonuclease [Metabacillus arenae]|uniref:Uma2 family endonuclease n=1 Tax=Metabacillus arenae TaxID=2771434 RepID=A0A926NG45_9BACI|nr:Uma2 family endonuclease [Metabacillus arenae]MBD1382829.1 Uma2 family endonuclease [Metabacillus arenae]
MGENKRLKQVEKVKEHTEEYEEARLQPLIEERYEIINGVRYDLKPSPTFNHQVLVTQLLNRIYSTCYPSSTVVVAPMDVHLDEENTVQPDVIYISNENHDIIQNQRIEGPPDLLVEILSPSTSKKDKILKKELYERFGIKEYWIVDPVHHIIDQLVLEKQHYVLHASYGLGDKLSSPQFSCISIDMNKLYEPLLKK